MKYFEKDEQTLLQRSFAIGLVGIILSLEPYIKIITPLLP